MISTNSAIMYFFGVFRLYISILFLYMSSEYHKLTGLIAEGLKAGNQTIKAGNLFLGNYTLVCCRIMNDL